MSYYAVKAGHTTGVFDNWGECQKATQGYSGADFKKFETVDEAEAYINGVDIYWEAIKKDVENGYAVAFCDGSYDKDRKRYSYGVLIIDQELQEHEICGSSQNAKYASSMNIIGEVLGAINSMDWAVSNGSSKLKIYHDYEGLGKWLSGEWLPKSEVAKMYVAIYNSKYADLLLVDFEKVKGHSNNVYNDKADELAKRALSENSRIPITGDSWFVIPYFKEDDLQVVLSLIIEEYPEITIEKSDRSNSVCHKLVLDKNRLTITLFRSRKGNLLVQGTNSILFQLFVTYVNELIGVKGERVFSDAYRTRIDATLINDEMKIVNSCLPDDYPESAKRLIRQAIINLHYFVESEDYSQYVFPAFRALEGHMKYLFAQENVSLASKRFNVFEQDSSGLYCLKPNVISDQGIKEELEKCYNYYNPTRHTLFHFGDIIGDGDSTRFIDTKSEADEHIKKCLSYILRRME